MSDTNSENCRHLVDLTGLGKDVQVLTVLGALGFLAGLCLVVPLIAYWLSWLLDHSARGGGGDEGRGGLLSPIRPGPSEPPAPMTRSADSEEPDGTVS